MVLLRGFELNIGHESVFFFFWYQALTNYFLKWGGGGAKLHPSTGFLP